MFYEVFLQRSALHCLSLSLHVSVLPVSFLFSAFLSQSFVSMSVCLFLDVSSAACGSAEAIFNNMKKVVHFLMMLVSKQLDL